MLVDSDVLIWAARGNSKAKRTLDKEKGFSVSAVTYMELCQGMRDKADLNAFKKGLDYWRVTIEPIDQSISFQAMFLVERFCLSHDLALADALIAATAVRLGEPLLTGNTKHYAMIPEIVLKRFRP